MLIVLTDILVRDRVEHTSSSNYFLRGLYFQKTPSRGEIGEKECTVHGLMCYHSVISSLEFRSDVCIQRALSRLRLSAH